MKIYKFAVKNWKNDYAQAFWLYKAFPSAYAASKWADRISFGKNSMYLVICSFGEEKAA